MNKYLISVSFIVLIFLSGCISQQQVPPAQRVVDDPEKVTRFDYMEENWSYMKNDWITAKKITPYVLMKTFNIPREQATDEIKEFKYIQTNFNWFQRFFSYINLRGVRFYINPPE